MSSAELFLLSVFDIPCFIESFDFADVFVDSAAIVLLVLSLSSIELPFSIDVVLFPVDSFS